MSDVNLNIDVKNDYHFGHIILDCFKRRCPDHICHINGATDEKETFKSVLHRTVTLARSLRNFGLKPGDIIALSGFNHISLPMPYYASMMNGMPIAGVDPLFKYAEIKNLLKIIEPKMVFCQYDKSDIFKKVAKDLNRELTVVTFSKGDFTMENFIKKYDDKKPIDDFEPATFDVNKIYAWLITTSGVTGVPKVVAIDHQTAVTNTKDFIGFGALGSYVKDRPQKRGLMLATIQCMSTNLSIAGMALVNTTLLVTSSLTNIEHIVDITNKYKPAYMPISPSFIALMLEQAHCDFSCFDVISIGGARSPKEMLVKLQSRMRKDATIVEAYGSTEAIGAITVSQPDMPFGSCGSVLPGRQVKLVDANDKEITEPYIPGELLYKGPRFSEYYKNPEETAKVFTEDGWMRTGDQLYRDEKHRFYYVERLKMIMKYRNVHIIPTELEEIILKHPGVLEVCVTSILHPIDQEWPVACVVRRDGATVTAQEIKDMISENLSDTKLLRGGVIFMERIPKLSTGKVARMKLREYVTKAKRE